MTFSANSAAFIEGYRAAISLNATRDANNYARTVRNTVGKCESYIIDLASAWEAGFCHGGGPKKHGEVFDAKIGLWVEAAA